MALNTDHNSLELYLMSKWKVTDELHLHFQCTRADFRAVNPPFLAGRFPLLEAVSLSPYFKRNLPVFENNQFINIKIIVYENDMRKNSLFSFTNFLGSA